MKQFNDLKLPITGHHLVVGSYPLDIRFSRDIDVICYKKDIDIEIKNDDYIVQFNHNNKKIECLLADNQESLQFALENYQKTTFGLLWAIKKGHIVFPHSKWKTHIQDLHILSKIVVPNVESRDNELWKLHRKSTKSRLKIRTPRLKGVTKEDFFDDYVTKHMDHDLIHEAMAHKPKPMYTYMQTNPNLVECDKNLWNTFTFQEKIWTVMEEAYVIASERFLIPYHFNPSLSKQPKIECFRYALQRICTTLCSGWFREFAVENYFEIFNQYDESKFNVIPLLIQQHTN